MISLTSGNRRIDESVVVFGHSSTWNSKRFRSGSITQRLRWQIARVEDFWDYAIVCKVIHRDLSVDWLAKSRETKHCTTVWELHRPLRNAHQRMVRSFQLVWERYVRAHRTLPERYHIALFRLVLKTHGRNNYSWIPYSGSLRNERAHLTPYETFTSFWRR